MSNGQKKTTVVLGCKFKKIIEFISRYSIIYFTSTTKLLNETIAKEAKMGKLTTLISVINSTKLR